jgi:hypothetical protein
MRVREDHKENRAGTETNPEDKHMSDTGELVDWEG